MSVEGKAGLSRGRIFSSIVELLIFKVLCQHEAISMPYTSVSHVNEGSYRHLGGEEAEIQEVNYQRFSGKLVASHEAKCLSVGFRANAIVLPFCITCLQILHLLGEFKKLSESLMNL